jgi:hypothetical protein
VEISVIGERIGLRRLIDRITDDAMCEGSRNMHSTSSSMPAEKSRPLSKSDMPGYRIAQLSPAERKVLSMAKPEDFGWRGFK